MDQNKFKDLLLRVSTLKLQKPMQLSKLTALQSQLTKLKQNITQVIPKTQQSLQQMETLVNTKTSQISNLQTKNRRKWQEIGKRVQKEVDRIKCKVNEDKKKTEDLHDALVKKANTLHLQLKDRNETYVNILNNHLQTLKLLRESIKQRKSINTKLSQQWMENGLKQADKILSSQEKDLQIIDETGASLISKCDELENQLLGKLEEQQERSNQKQKMLYRKLQSLIGDINLD